MTPLVSPSPEPLARLDDVGHVRLPAGIEKLALLLPVEEVAQTPATKPDSAAIRHGRADPHGTGTPNAPLAGGPSSGASRETLSAAARTILDVLDHADAAPVRANAPVLPAAPERIQPAALAPALRHAIEGSGLFYESHVKAWHDGERPLALLRQEPQGVLPARSTAAAEPAGGVCTLASPEAPARDATPVHPDAASLVRAQLETLAAQQVQWRGELWSGMGLDWRIDMETDPDANGAADGGEAVWSTRLALDFPSLGSIEATLRLGPSGIEARLLAATPEAGLRLQIERETLAGRLAAGGQPVSGLLVQVRQRPEDIDA